MFCGRSRGGPRSIVFIFSVESESIPFLSPRLCLFSWKYVWRFGAPSPFCLFVFIVVKVFFFVLGMFLHAHRGETSETLMWYHRPHVHVWYTVPLFSSRVIDKLVFF